MTSLPYPFFTSAPFAATLTAAGRCRIRPSGSEYEAILQKNKLQALVDLDDSIETELEKKKLQKKYMKEGVALAKRYLEETLALDVSVCDVEVVFEATDIIETDGCICACFLDAGCQTIVCNEINALEASKVPRERVMGSIDAGDITAIRETMAALREFCSMISLELTTEHNVDKAFVTQLLDDLNEQDMHLVICMAPSQCLTDDLSKIAAYICGRLKEGAGTVCLRDPTALELGSALAACLKTDRTDKLFTTVVCSRSGEALGLVYSSTESIIAALECGRGVYYSRSRHGLWRKGDTSGHFQDLHRIDVDCDGDALRFTVTQRGNETPAFCHLGTLTCWGHPRGIRQLEGVLQERLRSAPAGSYTKRLFDDADLLRDKLVEEAQELSEAESKQHVAEELADVLYFALVQATKAGVSIDDAVAELDKRARKVTRRKGDSKAFRIAAGNAILEKQGHSGEA